MLEARLKCSLPSPFLCRAIFAPRLKAKSATDAFKASLLQVCVCFLFGITETEDWARISLPPLLWVWSTAPSRSFLQCIRQVLCHKRTQRHLLYRWHALTKGLTARACWLCSRTSGGKNSESSAVEELKLRSTLDPLLVLHMCGSTGACAC